MPKPFSHQARSNPFHTILAFSLAWLTSPMLRGAEPPSPSPSLHGQVVNVATGRPVETARVLLDSIPADGNPEYQAQSVLFGLFQLEGIAAGGYELTVRHPEFLEYKESIIIHEDPKLNRNKRIPLTNAGVTPVFDLDFEIYDLATFTPLEEAEFQLEYWAPDGSITGNPDASLIERADFLGRGAFNRLKDGFYRFHVRREGWDPITYEPSSDIGILSGDKVRLIRDHLAGIYMKPKRYELEIQVQGFDPVKNKPELPLKDMVLQLTGYDFQFDNQVLPASTMLSDSAGGFTYTNLVPVNYKLSIAKLGYEPVEMNIQKAANGGFQKVSAQVELAPTKVKVFLSSPYETPDAVKGAKIKLLGVLNSSSEGIDRMEEAVVEEDGTTVSALFENLMPGRYWIQTKHEASIENLPNQSGPLQGPSGFHVSFFPRETFAQVATGVTEEIEIRLEPIPATVTGRLWATDESANLDFEPCFSEPNRLFYQKPQNGIEFVEHAVVDLLKSDFKVHRVDTDASGNYTALVAPGIYGLKIPEMAGYSGHNIEFGDLTAGQAPTAGPWPYADVWPYAKYEFGHHRAGIRLESSHEYQLDLFAHKHFIHVSGFINRVGEPFGTQVLRMNEDGTGVQTINYNHLHETDAFVTLTGPVSALEPVGKNHRYLFQNLPPGSYTIQLHHPDYDSDPLSISIEGWDTPGVIPRVEPFTRTYFFPGISHCDSQFDLTAEWKHKGQILFETAGYDPGNDAYVDTGDRRATYYTSILTGKKLFQYSGENIPAGNYTAWYLHDDGWFLASGSGSQTFRTSIQGGQLDNTTLANSPIHLGNAPGQTQIGSLSDYRMDLRAVSSGDPHLEIANVKVRFQGSDPLDAGGVVRFSGSPHPIGAQQEPGLWTYAFWPPSLVEVVSPEDRLLKVTVFMQRAMLIQGTLKGADGETIPGASITARNRYGNPIGSVTSQGDGGFSFSRLTPQTVYLDINRRGYKPLRTVFTPADLNNPDFVDQDLRMEKTPAPTVNEFTMNRFGMFIPGVTKASDSNISSLGLNAEASRGKLTATWKVKATAQNYSVTLPGFFGSDETPLPNEIFQVTDPVAEVWIVDRRSFRFPSINEPDQTDAGAVTPPSPLNYLNVRKWLAEITSASKNGEPYYVAHKIALGSERNEEGDFTGKIPLWELPSGEFIPRVVVITQNGGVRIEDYQLPMAGGEPAKPLRGMNLPKWASNILEVVGTAATLPKLSEGSLGQNDDEPETAEGSNRRQNTGSLNKNFGDRFLKIADSAKIEARIGTVPIDSSKDNPDRTIFNPTEDLLKTNLYLTYKYVLGVELPIGEDSPQSGPLSLASKFTGLKISGTGVDAEFEVAGADNQACIALVLAQEIEANKEAAKSNSIPWLVEKASKLSDRITFEGPKVGISAKFATCETYDSTEDGLNRLSMSTGILEAQGTIDLGVNVDITPVIQFLPYGKPIQELNETVKDLFDVEVFKLMALFELTTGAKVTAKFDFEIPKGIDTSATLERNKDSNETPAYSVVGVVSDALSDIKVSNEKKFILRIAVGLKGVVANGAISASGLIQLGAPKGASDTDGVFFDINDLDKQPLIKKIAGAVSFVMRAKLNLYVTSMSKSWQYDFLTFSIERGSVPVFEITPLHTSSIVITPATALPPVFNGRDGVIVDHFYDPGSIHFSTGSDSSVIYTGIDPNTGEMTLMMSRVQGDQWLQPTELARSAGILSLASAQLSDGSWIVLWSELQSDNVLDPFPPTVLKSVTSDPDGILWSSPATLHTSQQAIDEIFLESSGDNALVVFTLTSEGPMGKNHEVWTSDYSGSTWSEPSLLLESGPWTAFELAIASPAKASFATTTDKGDLILNQWDGVQWSQSMNSLNPMTPIFSMAYNDSEELVLSTITEDFLIALFQWDESTSAWKTLGDSTISSNSPEIELLPLQWQGEQVYLLTWLQGANQAEVWSAWFDGMGRTISPARPSTFESDGEFYDLQLRPSQSGLGHLVARHTSRDVTQIREMKISFPSTEDCDGDGLPDETAIQIGMVEDCNGNGIPDSCDIRLGFSNDINKDTLPDECNPSGSGDCNLNGVLDIDEIQLGMVEDIDLNGIPDPCDQPILEPEVQVISITPTEQTRFYRGLDLRFVAGDSAIILIQVRGILETAPTLNGPWSPAP